jgi:two-component system OmpR family response regulator
MDMPASLHGGETSPKHPVRTVTNTMESVTLVRWPAEADRLESLRVAGSPRLLLVDHDAAPPLTLDPLEDWVRLPAAETEVDARRTTLEARAGTNGTAPVVDGDGLLHYRDRWVALSPV